MDSLNFFDIIPSEFLFFRKDSPYKAGGSMVQVQLNCAAVIVTRAAKCRASLQSQGGSAIIIYSEALHCFNTLFTQYENALHCHDTNSPAVRSLMHHVRRATFDYRISISSRIEVRTYSITTRFGIVRRFLLLT